MNSKIVDIANQIIKLTDPKKIILFGSYARNDNKQGSDIDLLVVMPDGTHRRKTAQFLYKNIHSYGTPFDIIVCTIEDLEKHKDNIGLIYKSILADGVILYAA